MRILLANYEFPGATDNCGGGGEVTRQLAWQLLHQGHMVRVYTDEANRGHTTFPVRHYRNLRRVLREMQPHVVNAHFSVPTALPLARLCHKMDIPLVTTVMGADVYDPTRYQHIRPVLDRINKYVYYRSDAVVAPSTDMGVRLPSSIEHKSEVVHYGIDTEVTEWSKRVRSDKVCILTVCRMVPRKNLDLAIEATAELRDRGHDVTHTIVGKGPERARLVDEHGDKDWVVFPGFVDDLEQVWASHDLFYLPSKHEAFGMVFLEALASGLPVVTSDSGGQTDIVREGVVGEVGELNVESQLSALERVLDSYQFQQLGTRNYVEANFTAEQMGREYESLYEAVA